MGGIKRWAEEHADSCLPCAAALAYTRGIDLDRPHTCGLRERLLDEEAKFSGLK